MLDVRPGDGVHVAATCGTRSPDRIITVVAVGDIDAASVDRFASALNDADEAGAAVVLDLCGVTLLSAAGVGAIAGLIDAFEQRDCHNAVAVRATSWPARVLAICGLRHVLVDGDDGSAPGPAASPSAA